MIYKSIRIQKYLSDQGVCSRREAEDFIRRGLVVVNGKVVKEMGVKINPGTDKVEVVIKSAGKENKKESVIIYKPRGIVSSRIPSEGKTIYDLFPQFSKLNIVGRLDKESEGLLLLSNDGVIARAATGDDHIMEKEYEVAVREKINASQIIRSFEKGIELEDGKTLPAAVKVLNSHTFRVVLKEGRKHQIRRMCEYIHLTVVKLKRVRMGDVLLGNLGVGGHRFLTNQEVQKLRESRAKNKSGVIF
ncbi:MAG: pseudouridine synthase [Candidatus Wolfebacteria bacterium GW2011_GWA1_44_24]|uniref:Pseudouridine synthase n=1 Tax=Candidatus Wolfebacteria bacterium GW2011_GWB1_41_12 TaxID=1619006 RepID=A0A0G0WWJ3_9BACT|nr:MAG: pseudouridine synthase [Candidatus Wolfebacteria bacterium GW2011_GWB1_41_12]KKT56535.1 MAG: pseudouridine synthase [Candidatus Wolfebacteria bacterium GW2011_GWA1_44_24]